MGGDSLSVAYLTMYYQNSDMLCYTVMNTFFVSFEISGGN